ncbi:PIG-L deacetylase family protein [Alicyclobacillus vulcanalis]|uniref:N-acetylglucosaminyl deacetylase, LmbE family n=1 Tax=Alicyclobacillus vulcanalis TaxID=252246 RepID=A0A1N7L2E7_9BACL|nr:PIG-L deacetylase family protein [Alicyclobacillus vulcanalis]SIS67961.1 N-acetylglucosaminyl deacetylase, LmbE family [Alicyclobacillus vulcanalis]
MDLRALLGLKALDEVGSALFVQPHPDDNEVGAGGTMAKLAAKGCRVVSVTVTDGRYGAMGGTEPEALARRRQAELEAACKALGVREHIEFGFEDLGSYAEEDVVARLIPVLLELRPEVVVTVDPWTPYEAHPDHLKVGRAVAQCAVRLASLTVPQGSPPYVPRMFAFYASAFANTAVDVTDHWAYKIQAIEAHRSQFDTPEWPALKAYFEYEARQAAERWLGNAGNGRLAEAFKLLSPRQLHFFPQAMSS